MKKYCFDIEIKSFQTKKPEENNNIVVVINNSNEPQPGYNNVGNINTNEIQNTYFNRRKRRTIGELMSTVRNNFSYIYVQFFIGQTLFK